MGKKGRNFKPFTTENVQNITAKKLQEKESNANQSGASTDTNTKGRKRSNARPSTQETNSQINSQNQAKSTSTSNSPRYNSPQWVNQDHKNDAPSASQHNIELPSGKSQNLETKPCKAALPAPAQTLDNAGNSQNKSWAGVLNKSASSSAPNQRAFQESNFQPGTQPVADVKHSSSYLNPDANEFTPVDFGSLSSPPSENAYHTTASHFPNVIPPQTTPPIAHHFQAHCSLDDPGNIPDPNLVIEGPPVYDNQPSVDSPSASPWQLQKMGRRESGGHRNHQNAKYSGTRTHESARGTPWGPASSSEVVYPQAASFAEPQRMNQKRGGFNDSRQRFGNNDGHSSDWQRQKHEANWRDRRDQGHSQNYSRGQRDYTQQGKGRGRNNETRRHSRGNTPPHRDNSRPSDAEPQSRTTNDEDSWDAYKDSYNGAENTEWGGSTVDAPKETKSEVEKATEEAVNEGGFSVKEQTNEGGRGNLDSTESPSDWAWDDSTPQTNPVPSEPARRDEEGHRNSRPKESEAHKEPCRSDKAGRAKDPRMERDKDRISANSSTHSKGNALSCSSHSENSEKAKDKCEKEYDLWEKDWGKIKDFRRVQEIQGDLFNQPKDYSLAHCVAEDLRMGSGIAVDFKREFKNLPDLLDQKARQGGLATLHDQENGRYVYYLVTKRESSGKPTYLTLWKSLCKMRDHMKKNEVKKLAIPRLACGLDRLEWNRVKSMLEHLFKETDIDITVCNFQQDDEAVPKRSVTCKLVVESYHINEIAAETLIFYFSTENGDTDQNAQELSKKFNFLPGLKSSPKKLGDIIYKEEKNYGLCGCIVRKTTRDPISFKSLSKCVTEFNKKNKGFGQNAFQYVAFQWVDEKHYHDDMVNQKIMTILINQLRNVDVYVCWGSSSSNENDK